MDVNAYWQEHKRFLSTVAVCVVIFFVVWAAIDGYVGDSLRAGNGRLARVERDLRQPMFSAADLAAARSDNEDLRRAVDELAARVEFHPRPEFEPAPGTSASSRYFAVVSDVRDDLETRAGRAGLSIPGDLGLPALSPTREQEIARYLEGLDVVDTAIRLAIEVGCERIDRIHIAPDPRLLGGKAIGDLERTEIELRFTGASPPLVRLLELLQRERDGRTLAVDQVEVQPARTRSDEVRMDLTLVATHLHGLADGSEAAE